MPDKTDPAARPVVRFAPSPTGYLHIGGARTALFNWLYAKAKGGRFLLRIEDTDRARNTEAAVAAIIDGLTWLGLDWEGDPVSQFARADRHRKAALDMLARGRAYKCFLTAAEIDAMRGAAEAEKRPLTIRSPWRDRDPEEAPEGAPHTIRLRAPREGETIVDDRVQGRVVFPNKDLDDLIMLRGDGAPTYNLAVVVDDHDMGVSHVIRGVDHLTNAARQTQIYEAMDRPVPVFAHVPLIHGADGAKLSKRHGALGVEAYRDMGYLPAALRNYLVRLGWSHGDDEIISTEQLIAWFDLDGIGKSPARLDLKKLDDLNGRYIRESSDAELVRRIEDILPDAPKGVHMRAEIEHGVHKGGKISLLRIDTHIAPSQLDETTRDKLTRAMPSLKARAKTLLDVLDGANFLFSERPLKLTGKAAELLDDQGRGHLVRLLSRFEGLADWRAAAIEAEVRRYAEETGAKLGQVAQPLRAALTGRAVSPPVFDVMAVLGREESLARLADQANKTHVGADLR